MLRGMAEYCSASREPAPWSRPAPGRGVAAHRAHYPDRLRWTPCSPRSARMAASSPGAHESTTRPWLSPKNSDSSGSASLRSDLHTERPLRVAMADSASATASPPSAQSCAERTSPARMAAAAPVAARARPRGRWPARRRGTAVDHLQVLAGAQLVRVAAQQDDGVALGLEAVGGDVRQVVDHAHHPDGRGGEDARRAVLVVERDVAARDWRPQHAARFADTLRAPPRAGSTPRAVKGCRN